MKHIAVILCGSGHSDGSEIHEAVLTLLCLSQQGAQAQIYAPNRDQHHVINHLTGTEVPEAKRNMLEEAARIARGNIKNLSELKTNHVQGIILPGGFGAAKNLCTFAFQAGQGTVLPELRDLLIHAHSLRIPIGAICIAPAIVALTFKGTQVKPRITLGETGESSKEIEKIGAIHGPRAVTDIEVDEANRIVTTPAYMYSKASLGDLYLGINKLVAQILAWA